MAPAVVAPVQHTPTTPATTLNDPQPTTSSSTLVPNANATTASPPQLHHQQQQRTTPPTRTAPQDIAPHVTPELVATKFPKLPPNFTFLTAKPLTPNATAVPTQGTGNDNMPGSSTYKRQPFEPPLHIQHKHLQYRFASSDNVSALDPTVTTNTTTTTQRQQQQHQSNTAVSSSGSSSTLTAHTAVSDPANNVDLHVAEHKAPTITSNVIVNPNAVLPVTSTLEQRVAPHVERLRDTGHVRHGSDGHPSLAASPSASVDSRAVVHTSVGGGTLRLNASAPVLPHVSEEEYVEAGTVAGDAARRNGISGTDTTRRPASHHVSHSSVFHPRTTGDRTQYLEYQQNLLRQQQMQLLQKQRLQLASQAALKSALTVRDATGIRSRGPDERLGYIHTANPGSRSGLATGDLRQPTTQPRVSASHISAATDAGGLAQGSIVHSTNGNLDYGAYTMRQQQNIVSRQPNVIQAGQLPQQQQQHNPRSQLQQRPQHNRVMSNPQVMTKNVADATSSMQSPVSYIAPGSKLKSALTSSTTDLTKQQQLASLYSSRTTSTASVSSLVGQKGAPVQGVVTPSTVTATQVLDPHHKVMFYTAPKRFDYRRGSIPKGTPPQNSQLPLNEAKRSSSTPAFQQNKDKPNVTTKLGQVTDSAEVDGNMNLLRTTSQSPSISRQVYQRRYGTSFSGQITDGSSGLPNTPPSLSYAGRASYMSAKRNSSSTFSSVLPFNRGSSGFLQAMYDEAMAREEKPLDRHIDVDDETILSNSLRSKKNNSQHYIDGYDEEELMFANKSKEEFMLEERDQLIAPGQYLGQDGKIYFDPVKYQEELRNKSSASLSGKQRNDQTNGSRRGSRPGEVCDGKNPGDGNAGFFVGEDEGSGGEDDGSSSFYSDDDEDDDYYSSDEWQDSQSEREEREWQEKKKMLQEQRCKRIFAKQPIGDASQSTAGADDSTNGEDLKTSASHQSILSSAIRKSGASLASVFRNENNSQPQPPAA